MTDGLEHAKSEVAGFNRRGSGGWKSMSPEDSFYRLVFKLLREEKPGEDGGAAG
jgi:hypothetical protein